MTHSPSAHREHDGLALRAGDRTGVQVKIIRTLDGTIYRNVGTIWSARASFLCKLASALDRDAAPCGLQAGSQRRLGAMSAEQFDQETTWRNLSIPATTGALPGSTRTERAARGDGDALVCARDARANNPQVGEEFHRKLWFFQCAGALSSVYAYLAAGLHWLWARRFMPINPSRRAKG